MMRKEQIDKVNRLDELAAKATPGEWAKTTNGLYYHSVETGDQVVIAAVKDESIKEFLQAATPQAVSELIAMLREAQKDAARYQWLRSENTGPSMIEMVSDDCNPPSITLKCEEELDSAIDAAMQRDCEGNNL